MNDDWQREKNEGTRFDFGKNWESFAKEIDGERIQMGRRSLTEMLALSNLSGRRLADVGCGSGLFSLCAREMGASVVSFDFDPNSVNCTTSLQMKYRPNDAEWRVLKGSVLDRDFVASLGEFDIVYSWGVLHHTGKMWLALENAAKLVKSDGKIFIAIYNDQGPVSKYWLRIKRAYNLFPSLRPLIILLHSPYLFFGRLAFRTMIGRKVERGMSIWHDMLDWLGGYPFEVARPEQIFGFYRDRGFELLEMKTCGGRQGCNEFVFRRRP